MFKVDTKRIREWRKAKEEMIKCGNNTDSKRKRLEGGGCKVTSEDMDRTLIQWVFTMRHRGLRVSRKMMRVKASELFREVEDASKATFKASRGWLDKFMKRANLSVRRRTTVAQKTPDMMTEKMVSFIRFMERARERTQAQPADIYAMDETAVWFDMMAETTVNEKGAKSVCMKTTGHEKSRCTVILTANGSGKKLKPYVVFFRGSRKVKELNEKKQTSGNIVSTSVNGWMNDELTTDYLRRVIGKLAFRKRILVWDAYRCHLSESTKKELKSGYNLTTAVIPGGCTKFLQAPDVCWNKPFKDKLHELYDAWMAGDEDKEYTKTGNLKAPSYEVILKWVKVAWDSIDAELIKKSFIVCGQTSGMPALYSLPIHIEFLKAPSYDFLCKSDCYDHVHSTLA
jgi:hypothetical protein